MADPGVMTIFVYKELSRKEISPSEFCPTSGDWGKLGVPNLALMPLMKCYWMLQNTRVTVFTIPELLRETNKVGEKLPNTNTRIKLYLLYLLILMIYKKTNDVTHNRWCQQFSGLFKLVTAGYKISRTKSRHYRPATTLDNQKCNDSLFLQ